VTGSASGAATTIEYRAAQAKKTVQAPCTPKIATAKTKVISRSRGLGRLAASIGTAIGDFKMFCGRIGLRCRDDVTGDGSRAS
jgi:hypothetical protein